MTCGAEHPGRQFLKISIANLNSLTPMTRGRTIGVVVDEIIDRVEPERAKKLKYGVPDIQEYEFADRLTYNELALVAGQDPHKIKLDLLSAKEKARCGNFVETWYKKLDLEGPARGPCFGGGDSNSDVRGSTHRGTFISQEKIIGCMQTVERGTNKLRSGVTLAATQAATPAAKQAETAATLPATMLDVT